MEDKRITEMFMNKEEDAITMLIEKYGRLLKKLSLNILGNEEDAEECVNDACLEVWNSIPPSNPDVLSAYACKIVRRISINRLRYNLSQKRDSNKTVSMEELSEELYLNDDSERFVNSRHLQNVLNEFLRSLDDESRNLFVKRYFFFETVSSLSEHFGIRESKISVRLFRMKQKLLERLKEEGVYE